MTNRIHLLGGVGAVLLPVLVAIPTAAQAQQASSKAEESISTEKGTPSDEHDIVVTAQKREERLQNVPIAVSAVSAEQLAKLGINNPTELRYVSPSLNFSSSANVRGQGFAIRGIATVIFSDAIEQSVGTVVDGVPLARSGQAIADLVDIDHVEILRGPQGTLFGKNASAGLLSIITRRPQFTNSAEGHVSYGTYNEVKADVTGNLALSDSAALRVTYAQTTADGYIRNIVRNELLGGRDSRAVRAKLLLKPAHNLDIYVIGDWSRSNSLCCAWTARSAPLTTVFGQLNALAGIRPSPTNLQIAADQPFFQNIKTWGISTEINFDAGWATLTSLSAYRRWEQNDNNDPDILPINYLNVNSGANQVDQYSEELRIASPSGERLEWTGGVFLYDWSTAGQSQQSGQFALPLPPGVQFGSSIDSRVRSSGTAIFGQASYELINRLKLILGGRYTDETIRLNFRQFATPGTLGSIPGRFLGTVINSAPSSNFSGKATLQYAFNNDTNVFASFTRGYKGPGFDTLGIVSNSSTLVRPEIPTSYEIGFRAQLFNHSTTFNVTAFLTDYKDFQAASFSTDVTPSRILVTNAGLLKTRGVEADFESRPLAGVTLLASAAYVDSEYSDFKNISCYAGQPILPLGTVRTSPRQCILVTPTQAVTDADGLPLQNSPKFTYNLAAGYQHHLGSLVLDGQINWFWRGKTNFDVTGNPDTVQGAYGLLGANFGVGPASHRWRLSIFARNLLDKNFADVIFSQPVLSSPGVTVQIPSRDARRQLGVALNLKFGK